MNYVPLHVHSWYSMLEGVDAPEVLVRRAAECGYRAMALTDTGGLYGAVAFRHAAERWGVRPIFGATLEAGGRRCVALVANRAGYENLCRLITMIHTIADCGLQIADCRFEAEARSLKPGAVTPDQVPDFRLRATGSASRNLQPTTLACLIAPLAEGLHLLTRDLELAEGLYRQIGPERLWLELVRPGSRAHEWRLWRLHQRLGIPIVASTNAHFATPAGYQRHLIVTAIRENTLLERVQGSGNRSQESEVRNHASDNQESGLRNLKSEICNPQSLTPEPRTLNPEPSALAHPQHALHPPRVIERLFADLPVAFENAAWLAEQCESDVLPCGPFIPRARVPRGMTADQYLWALCRQGLERRYSQGSGFGVQGSVISGQWSVISGQWSVVSDQQSGVSDQESGVRSQANRGQGSTICNLKSAICNPQSASSALHPSPSAPLTSDLCPLSSGPPPSALRSQLSGRLERELAVITACNLADYFLVVREIVMFSREQGLPVALRGSGGNCLTAYLIGITDVDPLEYDLPMERFLHEEREDLPDLDIDFCWRVRDQVIEHVFQRFGREHTAMISSHITLQPRSAFREVAKVHGLSEAEVSRLIERLPQRVEEMVEEAGFGVQGSGPGIRVQESGVGSQGPEVRGQESEIDVQAIVAQARALVGAPHHLSVHPGGVVITPRPIDHYVPLERAEKGVIITQFEKDAAEAVGLVKFDLLGNRSLSTVAEATRLVLRKGSGFGGQRPEVRSQGSGPRSQESGVRSQRSEVRSQESELRGQESEVRNHASDNQEPGLRNLKSQICNPQSLNPEPRTLNPELRPALDDSPTIRLLQRGDTLGVGQLESPAMRHLLIMLRPRSLYDVMQALALVRPGAASIGCKELFIKRRRGSESVQFVHPCLEPVLRDTYGLMLYEDDAMQVVAAMTGMSLAEGDRFRKAITKCQTDAERERWSREFLRRAVAHGVPADAAKEQWVHIAKFNSYSFCKSHAASYAQLAWAAAYLKAHYPLEFWVAALNNNQSMYETRVYIEEIKRSGIHMLLPCVNRSGDEFTIDERAKKGSGLFCLKGPKGASHKRDPTPFSPAYEGGGREAPAIRIGLGQVAGLSQKTRERILNECQGRPYRSLEDLLARVPIGPEEATLLIRAGALDFTGRPRPELLLEAAVLCRSKRTRPAPRRMAFQQPGCLEQPGCFPNPRRPSLGEVAGSETGYNGGESLTTHHSPLTTHHQHSPLTTHSSQLSLFDAPSLELPALEDYSPLERLRDEFALLGLSAGPHLMAVFRPWLERRLADSRVLAGRVGRRVVLAGIVATARHTPTKNGELMQFVTLEDEHGIFEVTLFPHLCARVPYLRLGPYLVDGTVEEQHGVVTVTAKRFELFEVEEMAEGGEQRAEGREQRARARSPAS